MQANSALWNRPLTSARFSAFCCSFPTYYHSTSCSNFEIGLSLPSWSLPLSSEILLLINISIMSTAATSLPHTEHRSRNVRRTRISLVAEISPFVLDPSAVTLQRKRSSGQYDASYLHTAAVATRARTHREALQICEYMDRLRHPHLEQFIGVVTDTSLSYHMIVTERHQGHSIAHYLSTSRSTHANEALGLDLNDVLQIAKQSALALHYLHQVSKSGHHALCPHSIVYNKARAKAIVLLTTECKECRFASPNPSRRADVQTLAKLVSKLLYSLHSHNASVSSSLSSSQLSVIASVKNRLTCNTTSRNTVSISMSELCKLFDDAQNKVM